MTHQRWSLSIGLVNSFLVAVAVALALSTTAVPWPGGTWGPRFGLFPAVIGMGAIGWLLTRRRPDNRVGWLLSIAGSFGGLNLATLYGALFCRLMGWDTAGQLLGFVAEWSWIPAMTFVLLALARFPHGDRAPGWRGPAIDIIAGVAMVSVALSVFLSSAPMSNTEYPKPGFIPSVPASAEGALGLLMLPWLLLVLAVAWTLVSSYRQATGIARQQFRWVVYAGGIFLSSFVLLAPWLLGGAEAWWTAASISNSLLLGVLFVAIGTAILRYRLYDLDRIVSRSLTYLLLTAVLVGVYATSILLLGGALRRATGSDPEALVVAASTLVAVALFEPLRQRFQRVIDRRLYRSRFDAQQAIQSLGAQLADQLDDAALRREIAGAVARTLAPSTVAVWEPGTPGHTPVTPAPYNRG